MTTVAPLHSTRKRRAWQEPVGIGALLAVLTAIYFPSQLFDGKVLYWGDIGLYFTPMLSFLHDGLLTGRLPLWNPLILCGTPYVGNPQTWPLYPFTALLGGLSAPQFISVSIAFHIWFAAFGTYFFLRRATQFDLMPAVLGAIVFAFGGQLVSKEQFPNMVQAASYLPWILWLTQRIACDAQRRDAVLLGATLGLQLLAAHAQMTFLTLYLAVAYGLWTWRIASRDRHPSVQRLLWRLTQTGLVAAGLAAGQLLPTFELYRDAWRQRLSFHVVDRFYLPLNQLGNFVLPMRHGHPFWGDFTARGNFWETCCYVGCVALALAGVGFWTAWRKPAKRGQRFWVVVFVVGLLLALGGQGLDGAPTSNGLYWLAYHLLPGFRSFHDPARCLLWSAFALAVLAAAGLQALPIQSVLKRRSDAALALLIVICFFDLAHFGRTLYPLADGAALSPASALVTSLNSDPEFQAHQARLLAPDSARAWQRFTTHRSFRQDDPHYITQWTDTLTPNLMMPYGLRDAYGYEPVTQRATQTIVGTAAQSFWPSATPSRRATAADWAGFLGVRAVATLRARPPEAALPGLMPLASSPTLAPLGHSRQIARVWLSVNTRWQPRARLMTDFRTVTGDAQSQSVMTRALLEPQTIDLAQTVVITGNVPFASEPSDPIAAAITQDDADQVVIDADTTRPSLLVLADTQSPGWHAEVNGKPATILTANDCLRAVVLPQAGPHVVEFRYRPESFVLGLYCTLVMTAFLVAYGLQGALKPKK